MSAQIIPFARPELAAPTPVFVGNVADALADVQRDLADLEMLLAEPTRSGISAIAASDQGGVQLHIRLQRRSQGPKRTFWVSPHGTAYYRWPPTRRLYVPLKDWDAGVITSIAEALAGELRAFAGEGSHVVELLINGPGFGDRGRCITPCVRIGRWRACIDSTYEHNLPQPVREMLLALPFSDDSWTPADEAREQDAAARTRELNATLLKVRHLIAKDPDAWRPLEHIIDTLLGDDEKGVG